MHFDLTDVYRPGASSIHRLDPRVKLLGVFALILVVVTLPQGAWPALGLVQLLVLLIALAAGLGPLYTLRAALIALPFMLAAVPIPFLTPGPVLWVVPGLGWAVSGPGLERFATILLRTVLAVQAGALLSATTSVPHMLWGLQSLGLPALLVAVVGFMLRYLFVLGDEALRMLRARASRSARTPDGRRPGFVWQGRMAGMMVGSLFLRSLERSERVYAAMSSRGYRGQVRLLQPQAMTLPDWSALLCIALLLAAVIALGLWS